MWIHEVKTPLASCKLLLENRRSEMSYEMEKELEQIDYYLEQVLYYARSESAVQDYIIRKVSLEVLVKDTLRQQSKQFIRHKVQPVLADLQYEVCTDVKWAGYMIGQILGNAVKYKQDPAKVEISAREADESILLEIRDNGIGIPEEDLARVTDRGFTGKTGRV